MSQVEDRMRAQATQVAPLPQIVVPSRVTRVRIRGTCPTCRGSGFEIQWMPTGFARAHVADRGDVVCLLCGSEVAKLVIGATT